MTDPGDQMRILHVDDEPDFAEMATTFLERNDHRFVTETATSAQEGLDRLADEEFDCIISDYNMPGQDGIQFLEAVREVYPDLPFILYTGKGSEEVASEAISKQATDYLQKRSGAEQYELLANRVRNAVEQYRSQRRAAEHERVTRVIRELNRVLVYADSVDDIEHEVCRVLSSADPYVTACIAGVNSETMQIEPRTWAGDAEGYFAELEMSVGEGDPGRQAPGGRAFHDRELAISQNIPDDPTYEHWREAATDRGFRSLAVIPLEYENDLYGLLAVFADRRSAFDDAEQELLAEVGDDIAHAIHAQEMQSELRTTASRLEALFEWSPDMINVHDTDGNILDPNPRLCEQTGYDEDELTGKKVWELDQTIDHEEAFTLWEGMDVGDRHRLEGVYKRRDGSTFPVEVNIRCLRFDGENRFIVISRNISDRRERQTELERYERIVENLPVGVFRTTASGDLVSMNERFVSLFDGESRADLADVDAMDLYANPADREAILDELEREGFVDGHRHEVKTLDGESRWVETTLQASEEDGDQYMDGIVHDVTEHRQRRRRLEQTETMFENAQDALFLVDVTDGFAIERANPALEEMTGFSEDELVGQRPSDFLGDEQAADIERMYRECVDRQTTVEFEDALSIGDEQLHLETRIAPVVIDGRVEKIVGATRDITDRNQRNRELRRTERRYRAILEDPNILAGVLDTDGHLMEANRTAIEYIDADRADVIGEPFWETPWWPEEMQSAVRDNVEQAAAGEYVDYEADLTAPGGDPYSVEGVIRPVTNDTGDVVSLIVSARDVTRRKDRERALRELNKQFERLTEAVPDGLFLVSTDYSEVYHCNSAAEDLYGVSLEQVQSDPTAWTRYVHPDDMEQLEEDIRAQQNGQIDGTQQQKFRVQHPEQGTRWLEVKVHPVEEEGEIDWLAGVATDITERERRRRTLERYQRIVEAMDDIAFVVDDEWTIEFTDETIQDYVDAPLDALEGEPVMRLANEYVTNDDASDQFEQALERTFQRERDEGQPERVEVTLDVEGGTAIFEYQFSPLVSDGETTAVVITMRDITERKRREEQLRRQNERFDELASAVSHDLQTPLQTARGRVELAIETGETEQMERALAAIDRTDELRESLVEVLRTKEIVGETESVDIERVGQAAWKTVSPPDEASLQIPASTSVTADSAALRRLFENLLSNAIEHGGEDITVRIGDIDGGFFVEDDGPGIPADEREAVLTPGYSTKRGGSGVGLASVRQIATAHGWDISITDSPDGGARFEITGGATG